MNERIRLERSESRSLRKIARGAEIACIEGTVWVTFAGDPADYLLRSGDTLRPVKRRKPVVYAVEPCELTIRRTQSAAPLHLQRREAAAN